MVGRRRSLLSLTRPAGGAAAKLHNNQNVIKYTLTFTSTSPTYETGSTGIEGFGAIIILAIALLLSGCGGGSGNSQTLPVVTSVSVSGSNYIQAGICTNFTATVSGTGNYDRSVKWYVNNVA